MIDPDVLIEQVTEDVVVEALSDLESDKPHLSGAMPSNEMALEVVWRVLRRLDLEALSVAQPLGYCHCLSPITERQLEEQCCSVCGRTITLRIRRTAA